MHKQCIVFLFAISKSRMGWGRQVGGISPLSRINPCSAFEGQPGWLYKHPHLLTDLLQPTQSVQGQLRVPSVSGQGSMQQPQGEGNKATCRVMVVCKDHVIIM